MLSAPSSCATHILGRNVGEERISSNQIGAFRDGARAIPNHVGADSARTDPLPGVDRAVASPRLQEARKLQYWHASIACWVTVAAAMLGVGTCDAAAQLTTTEVLEDDFDGPYSVTTSPNLANASWQRIPSGGHPSGAFWRAEMTLPAVPFQCETGCVDMPVYLFMVDQSVVYDAAELGPIVRFDGSCIPAVTSLALGVFSSVRWGLVLEQDGFLFGTGMHMANGGGSGEWRGCPTVDLPCGFYGITQLGRLPDGLPGGPATFNSTQNGAPFRIGFYLSVAHVRTCCQETGGTLCCQFSPQMRIDMDHQRVAFVTCPPPVFQSSPNGFSTCIGGSATFSATASTATGAPASLRWRHNGILLEDVPGHISGSQTSMLTITDIASADTGLYDCIASGPCNAPFDTTTRASSAASLVVCAADVNCSESLTVQDIFDFLTSFFSNDPRSDFNNSGTISVQDMFDFLAAFFTGCS